MLQAGFGFHFEVGSQRAEVGINSWVFVQKWFGELCVRLVIKRFSFYAPVCSSWVWINRGTSHRSSILSPCRNPVIIPLIVCSCALLILCLFCCRGVANPLGAEGVESVAQGNVMVARLFRWSLYILLIGVLNNLLFFSCLIFNPLQGHGAPDRACVARWKFLCGATAHISVQALLLQRNKPDVDMLDCLLTVI